MAQTALQSAIESLKAKHLLSEKISCDDIASWLEQYLPEEKSNIIEAYREGESHGSHAASSFEWGNKIKEVTGEDYFSQTFNSKS